MFMHYTSKKKKILIVGYPFVDDEFINNYSKVKLENIKVFFCVLCKLFYIYYNWQFEWEEKTKESMQHIELTNTEQ